MRFGVAAFALLGVALAVHLVVQTGLDPIVAAVLSAGWLGFGAICLFQLGLATLLAAGWHTVAPVAPARRFGAFVWARLVRDAATEVLPFTPLGAFVAGSRALVLRGLPMATAFGSLVVDVTTEMAAQLVFTLASIGILAWRVSGGHSDGSGLIGPLLAGSALGAAAVVGFYLAQRRGLGLAEAVAGRWLPKAAAHSAAVRKEIAATYARPDRVAASFALHLLAWGGTALGSWIALGLMGSPLGFTEVLALTGLLYAVRSAVFFVPGGIGVQEAGYALIGPLLGLSPEAGLALSLLKRARDVVLGVPVLLAWQAMESRRALAPR